MTMQVSQPDDSDQIHLTVNGRDRSVSFAFNPSLGTYLTETHFLATSLLSVFPSGLANF
jgi:hypothetical protein